MRANLFLIINGLVVGFLLLRLLRGTKPPRPTPLNSELKRFRPMKAQTHQADPGNRPGEKLLNCFFQYNGHTWDAFEVLGLPAGSDFEACKRALHDMRRNSEAPGEMLKLLEVALLQYFS